MGRYKTRKQLEFIQRSLPRRNLHVLDVGGGNGRLAVPLADQGYNVTVLDESRLALDLLANEGHPQIQCVHSDILSFESAQAFDVALLVDSLKYMTHAPMVAIFSKIAELLRDNGLLIVIEMNTASWRYRVSQILGRVCRYSLNSYHGYCATFGESGFECVESRGSHWLPFTFNSDSSLVSAFALIERLLLYDRWVSQSPWVMLAGRKRAEFSTTWPRRLRSSAGEARHVLAPV